MFERYTYKELRSTLWGQAIRFIHPNKEKEIKSSLLKYNLTLKETKSKTLLNRKGYQFLLL